MKNNLNRLSFFSFPLFCPPSLIFPLHLFYLHIASRASFYVFSSFHHPSIPPSFQMPNLREKSILLVKMMTYIEKRFPDDLELNAQFLDLVNYVYR